MLLIFWDTKENPGVKKKIAKQLSELEKHIHPGKHKVAKVIFCDAKKIQELNKTFRKLDKITDVLSFAEMDSREILAREDKSLGEIYINYDWIKSGKRSVKELLIHGYLHLLGYDHETDNGEMEALEQKLRN